MNSVLSEAPSRGLFCDCEIFANLRLKLYEPPSSRVPGPGVPCPVGQPGVCRYLPPVDIYKAEDTNFELLDRSNSVSDDIPLVDLGKAYTQDNETLPFDSDEYPSSPENNVLKETAANPPLIPAENFGLDGDQHQMRSNRRSRPESGGHLLKNLLHKLDPDLS